MRKKNLRIYNGCILFLLAVTILLSSCIFVVRVKSDKFKEQSKIRMAEIIALEMANRNIRNELHTAERIVYNEIEKSKKVMIEKDELSEQIESLREEIKQLESEVEYYFYKTQWDRDVKLEDEYLIYIYEKCSEMNLDYELALAKISLESNFKIDAVGYNKDEDGNIKSRDVGLCQVNSTNFKWAEELLGRELDIENNVFDNIDAGLAIFKHYKDYWSDLGLTGEKLNTYTLNSYNFGVSGFKNYMARGNTYDSWRYAKLVYSRLEGIRKEH